MLRVRRSCIREPGTGFGRDRLRSQENCGEEQIAEDSIAKKEKRWRIAGQPGGRRLPPTLQRLLVAGQHEPAFGVGEQKEETRSRECETEN